MSGGVQQRQTARNLRRHAIGIGVFVQTDRVTETMKRLWIVAHDRLNNTVAVLVHEIHSIGRKARFGRAGRVGVQARHLAHEDGGRPDLGGNIGRQVRVGGRDDLPRAVDAPEHLHVRVDVRVSLCNDHAAAALVCELRRCVQRNAGRTGFV